LSGPVGTPPPSAHPGLARDGEGATPARCPGPDAARHLAWRRAVESAQCSSWFAGGEHAGGEGGRSSEPASRPEAAAAPPRPEARVRQRPLGMSPPVPWRTAGGAPPDGAPPFGWPADRELAALANHVADRLVGERTAPPGNPAAAIAPGAATSRGGAAWAAAVEASLPRTSAAAPRPAAPDATRACSRGRGAVAEQVPVPAPVRWHAEWSAEGLRLWLGAHPDLPLASLVEAMVRALAPRCAREGTRLLAVVCNGREAWLAAPDLPLARRSEERPTYPPTPERP